MVRGVAMASRSFRRERTRVTRKPDGTEAGLDRVRAHASPPGRLTGWPDSGHAARVSASVCASCGRPLDDHNRDIRFTYPEPVLDVPRDEREGRTWGNDVLMRVDGVGSFVRVLVPVHLTGGHSFAFGAWLGVHPDLLRKAYDVWWEPEYEDLVLEGHLANMLPPWQEQTLGRPLRATVRTADEIPYAASSSDEFLQRILTTEWSHEEVLGALAPYFGP